MVSKPTLLRASMMNTMEVVENLRGKYQKSGLLHDDQESEYIEANKLIWITLENDSMKSAVYDLFKTNKYLF